MPVLREGESERKAALTRRHVVFTLAAAALPAAACGTASQSGSTPPAGRQALQGTLVYRTWWTPAMEPHRTWWEFVKSDFEAKHPGVTFTLEIVPIPQAFEKFVTSAAAGDVPDVYHASVSYGRDLWDMGGLDDLSPYISKTPALALDNFIPQSLTYNRVGNKVFGIPHEGPDGTLLLYNVSHFQAAGLDPSPKAVDAWTWDTFTQAAAKLTRRGEGGNDRVGFATAALTMNHFGAWLYSQDGSFYNKDQTAATFDNERGESVLNQYVTLNNRIGPRLQGAAVDLWQQGHASIYTANMFRVGALREQSLRPSFDWNVMAIPKGPLGKSPATNIFVNMDTMPKLGKHKDLAQAWLTYYTGLEMARARMRIVGQPNPRKDFFETPEFKQVAAAHPQSARIPQLSTVGGPNTFNRSTETVRDVEPILRDAADGKRTARDAIREAARVANRILAQPVKRV
ncbi:MAG: hypothetical protein AVDCRST_MAG77-3342 [uncultured Chloroflexi bacterium]|uniref:Sugar ABC transporter substrate-binding protein n=1 Tax=uncultured Chloroflexota bacterium TaxID=166587 RepID=A0A6J4J9L9_9CHLR|nr:MAG: hypothetical protein AVDCRST_MAG77-3342 [uncultured Chloroflexota bacterium]